MPSDDVAQCHNSALLTLPPALIELILEPLHPGVPKEYSAPAPARPLRQLHETKPSHRIQTETDSDRGR